jgi:hypothetical protein
VSRAGERPNMGEQHFDERHYKDVVAGPRKQTRVAGVRSEADGPVR